MHSQDRSGRGSSAGEPRARYAVVKLIIAADHYQYHLLLLPADPASASLCGISDVFTYWTATVVQRDDPIISCDRCALAVAREHPELHVVVLPAPNLKVIECYIRHPDPRRRSDIALTLFAQRRKHFEDPSIARLAAQAVIDSARRSPAAKKR